MDKAKYYLVAGFFAAILLSTGCSRPIINLEKMTVPSMPDGSPRSKESAQSTILMGCRNRGWSARIVSEGLIEADIVVRRFRAKVQIPFSDSHYSILHEHSQGLDYDRILGTIHTNYNNWVLYLNESIQHEFGVGSQRF